MAGKNYNIKLLPPSLGPWRPAKDPSRQAAVLMSGGVDSSIAAYLLQQAGWDVLGITMKIPVGRRASQRGCCGAEAALVCDQLGLAHYFLDITEAFEQLIIEPFRRSYALGRTPNPCADCNRFVKFSLVWDFLRDTFGIQYLATGHYAVVARDGDLFRLGRAVDRTRDQSYFLYGIAAERLPFFLAPIGRLTKAEVRRLAAGLGLSTADKPQSVELCFADQQDYRAALPEVERNRPGEVYDMDGNKLGMHGGISNFTLGQRRGLGIACGKPVYVGRIDPKTNTVALGTREQVSRRIVSADGLNILDERQLAAGSRLAGKIRSYGPPKPCRVVQVSSAAVTVEFDQAQFAPCPGQKLVLYDAGGWVVAGGTITTED